VLLSLATVAPAQQVVGRDQETFTWAEAVARGNWFRFVAPMGDITVTQGGGDRVQVRARKVPGRGRIDDIGFTVTRSGDEVIICAVYEDDDDCDDRGYRGRNRNNSSRSRVRLDVTIQIPAGIKAHAQSGNGDVSVTGGTDEVIARSGNGEVRVDGSGGEVVAASGNGEVTVRNARGVVNAASGNGDVTVNTSRGPVTATSGNGDLTVDMDTLSGDDNMEFSTGNGRIRVTLPANFAGEIDASSGNGSVETDFAIQVTGRISRTRLRGTIGQGGRRVRLTTGNGQIELRRGG
jgi:hypothetical protein